MQHWHQGSLSTRKPTARHWLWLMLGSALLSGALMLYRAPEAPAETPRGADVAAAMRARAAQTMRSALDIRRTGPLPELASQSPETQSVLRYLRAHEVDQSLWDQVVARVRLYLHMRRTGLDRAHE